MYMNISYYVYLSLYIYIHIYIYIYIYIYTSVNPCMSMHGAMRNAVKRIRDLCYLKHTIISNAKAALSKS